MTSQVRKIYSRKFIHCVDVRLIVFIILGRLSKGEYSGLSNEEKCKLYRGKRSEQNKKNNVLCKKLQHAKLKENRITQSSIRSANDTANYKQKKTKQLKQKKLINVFQVQTVHSAINKHSIAAYPLLTITNQRVLTKWQKSSKNQLKSTM